MGCWRTEGDAIRCHGAQAGVGRLPRSRLQDVNTAQTRRHSQQVESQRDTDQGAQVIANLANSLQVGEPGDDADWAELVDTLAVRLSE